MYPQLTKEHIHPTTPKRLAWLLIASLAMFGVANLAGGIFGQHLILEPESTMIVLKHRILEDLDTPVDVLIVGDSAGNQGVDPATLDPAGISSVNLCTQGRMLLVGDLAAMRRYIQKFKTGPKVLLMVHVYDIFRRRQVTYKSILEYRSIQAAGIKAKFNFGGLRKQTLVFDHVIPLITKGRAVGDKLRGIPAFEQEHDRGYFAAKTPHQANLKTDYLDHCNEIKPGETDWTICEPHWAILDEILSLARQHDTHVVLAFSPVYDKLYANPAYQRIIAETKTALFDTLGHDHFSIVGPMAVPANQMGNTVDHVLHPAAQAYTKTLLSHLQPLLAK